MADKIDWNERVQPLSGRPPTVKMLFYGDPGVGKTVLAATAPNPLLVDTEKSSLSLLNHPELIATPVLKVKDYDDVEQLFWHLKQGGFPDRETIIIDTFSELQRKQMDENLKLATKKDANRDPYLPAQGDYKRNTEVMGRLIVAMQDLDRNLIITCHQTEEKDEDSGSIITRPGLTPKLAYRVASLMDVIGHMTLVTRKEGDKVVTERRLQVHPARRIVAKTRIGGLPTIMVNPTFSDIFKVQRVESAGPTPIRETA